MRDPGLRLDEHWASHQVPLDAVSSAGELEGRFDFALVTLKATHLRSALAPLADDDRVDAFVCLGNGLVQEQVAQLVGPARVLVGIVEWGATNMGPGHVKQTTVAPMVLGETDGVVTERVRRLAEILRPVAEVRVSSNISGQVWSKLLVNSTFSGLGAVSGMLYGQIAAHPAGREVAFALWREGYDVARAAGMTLDEVLGVHPGDLALRVPADRPRAEKALDTMMRRVAPTKSSMLQDLQRGALTEVDVINGGVTATAESWGLPAPLNAAIVQMVHECERRVREPGSGAFRDLGAPEGETTP
jgi:2-dehydropantoate 2-reductase